MVKFLIVCELDVWPRDLNTDFTLGGCLFGGVKLIENADPDKYWYNDYSFPNGSVGKNVIIFLFDMSSSVHTDNKGKDILILGKGPTQRLNHMLAAETQYSINFLRPGLKFFLSLYYSDSNSFLFVNAKKYISSKQKTLKWKNIPCV